MLGHHRPYYLRGGHSSGTTRARLDFVDARSLGNVREYAPFGTFAYSSPAPSWRSRCSTLNKAPANTTINKGSIRASAVHHPH